MTTITLPRATVEQALEALEDAKALLNNKDRTTTVWFADEITALRAALAQQAEPVAWEGWWLHHGQHNYRAKPLAPERVKELMKLAFEVGREAAPPQQAEPVEPVAEARYDGTLRWLEPHGVGLHRIQGPLYTAPPKRVPLTEGEAAALIELDPRMLKEFGAAPSGAAMELIRRTERAHGIGEEK